MITVQSTLRPGPRLTNIRQDIGGVGVDWSRSGDELTETVT